MSSDSVLNVYSCAKCRCNLFSQAQVLPHDSSTDAPGHKNFFKNKHSILAAGNHCTSVFLDPALVTWVLNEESESDEMKKYQEKTMKKTKQKMLMLRIEQQEKTKSNEHHEQEAVEEEEQGGSDDGDDDEWNNYNFQEKAQSDDEKDLFCPNPRCKTKLGSKQWQGTQCSCGAWITPAFKVLLSRVDVIPIIQKQQQQQQQQIKTEETFE